MKSALPDRCMQRILESSLGLSQLAFTVWRSFWRTFYDPRGIRVEGPSRPENPQPRGRRTEGSVKKRGDRKVFRISPGRRGKLLLTLEKRRAGNSAAS